MIKSTKFNCNKIPIMVSISVILVLLVTNQAVGTPPPPPAVHKPNILFLHSTGAISGYQFLSTELPTNRSTAVAILSTAEEITFDYPPLHTQGLLMRNMKFNRSDYPKIYIIVISQKQAGKLINIELRFDVDNDSKFEFKATFPLYKTTSVWEEEVINLSYRRYEGRPTDITNGWVQLAIWRSDNLNTTAGDVIIYCGAYNKISWLSIPFTPKELIDKDDTHSISSTAPNIVLGSSICVIIIIIIVIISIYLYKRKKVRY